MKKEKNISYDVSRNIRLWFSIIYKTYYIFIFRSFFLDHMYCMNIHRLLIHQSCFFILTTKGVQYVTYIFSNGNFLNISSYQYNIQSLCSTSLSRLSRLSVILSVNFIRKEIYQNGTDWFYRKFIGEVVFKKIFEKIIIIFNLFFFINWISIEYLFWSQPYFWR